MTSLPLGLHDPVFMMSSLRGEAPFRLGGATEIGWSVPWFYESGTKDHSMPEPKEYEEYARALSTLPTIDILKQLGSAPTDYENWISRNPADPWFDRIGFLREDAAVNTPTLFVNSWYDVGSADALHQRRVFRAGAQTEQARRHQHIILAPGQHCSTEKLENPTVVVGRDLGDARIDAWQIYLNWFDCWLNENPQRIETLPQVQYYVMGRNEWRTADDWPPPGVELQRWYLRSKGHANTRLGDGTFGTEPPQADEPADTFIYDPGNPTPAHGAQSGDVTEAGNRPDIQEVTTRQDILCFTTEPLPAGLEVTGFIKAVLYVSSSAPDTDIVAKLVDVYPDGRAFDVTTGILRLRYREGFDRALMMKPDQVYRVEVELDATSNWFAPGHQMRLQIASAEFPRIDRNLNTGGNNFDETTWALAHNTVHHRTEFPSHVLLPTT
ncbi:MAG: CocE/NonD family hydrolase [Comamonadaceae bacterium]|nr:MAG: CocE/NonD family hydrolase [Comamonadaceae bacterium]